MSSIFALAMGADFDRLHPRLQHRFGIGLHNDTACIGRGTMERVWRGRPVVAPFLRWGASRHLLFPETGRNVPFTIENYPYVDDFGREALSFVRTFEVAPGRRRRFDATMVHDASRHVLLDYLGTHSHIAADLDLSVEDGGLRLDCSVMRLHEGPVSFTLPAVVCGRAVVRERWDESARCFRIAVEVHHGLVGPVFGYHGRFEVEYVAASTLPPGLRPIREELRV